MIAPPLFGVDVNEVAPARDRKLAARAQQADFVIAARVSTLAREGVEDRGSYRLTLEAVDAAITGSAPVGPFDIVVPLGSPSYRLLHANRHAWVGTRLLLFGRRYNSSGEMALHWRAEPDSPEMRAAIRQHAATIAPDES